MDRNTATEEVIQQEVHVEVGAVSLEGSLGIPEGARGLVLFAHGSGSGRHSPRNRFVARQLQAAGLATLLVDLLTKEEEVVDRYTAQVRFDIDLLAARVIDITDWLTEDSRTNGLLVGYFGASTGTGAALVAAAQRPHRVSAIVSRGGRPDLAGEALAAVYAPTLLLVGGEDRPVIALNEEALGRLGALDKELVIVAGASHLFEEAGTLEEVARLAAEWFTCRLARPVAARAD
jgi:pimeloyl-ACP methyl ester carboxylesterase